jgi:hypothetical protein
LNFFANEGSKWKSIFQLANFTNSAQIGNVVYIAEKTISAIDVQVKISKIAQPPVDIPEPASLGILGLALVSLSLVNRRNK